MERVIVTVARAGDPVGMDLELPAEVEAATLARLVAGCFPGAEQRAYRLEAHPPGRLLRPEETLAGAGVWDGAWILLKQVEV